MNILFYGGCYWGFFEYIGALRYIKEQNIKFNKVYGISSGSAIALCFLLGINVEKLLIFMEKTMIENKNSSMTEIQILGCRYVLSNNPSAYKLLHKKLYVGVTDKKGFHFKTSFKSNEDLASILICGGSIPLLSSWKTEKTKIDGGIAFNIVPENTIVISPTAPLPLSAIHPPKWLQYILIEHGYNMGRHYIQCKNTNVNKNKLSDPKIIQLCILIYENICLFEQKSVSDLCLT
jgi:hypothetical protein